MPMSAAPAPFNGSTTRCIRCCGDGLSPVIPRKRNIGLRANTGEWTMDKAGRFQPSNSTKPLARHDHTPHQRYVKVQGTRSPYDGDWLYWSRRLGTPSPCTPRIARLLKQQQGRCRACGWYCMDGDNIEVDHILPKKQGGSDARDNLQLLHRHCHDTKTARETGCQGRMTRATLLRSRMNGNVHVRFCSRVGVATSRLRQRPEGEGRETVHRYPQRTRKLSTVKAPWSWRNGPFPSYPSLVSRMRRKSHVRV